MRFYKCTVMFIEKLTKREHQVTDVKIYPGIKGSDLHVVYRRASLRAQMDFPEQCKRVNQGHNLRMRIELELES